MSTDDPFDPGRPRDDDLRLERLVEGFERAWLRGERPAIERFLPTIGPRRAVLVELVHAELEFRLKAGEPARVEDYLRRFPELEERESVVLGLIAAESRRRRRREPGPDRGEYARRFGRIRAEALAAALDDAEGDPAPVTWGLGGDVPRPPATDPEAGRCGGPDVPRVIGRYELLEVVGRGAAGIVYRARDAELGRIVAIKVPRPDGAGSSGTAERFLREARSAAVLRHPNIVPVYDAGRDGETLYLVSAFVRGVQPARRDGDGRLVAREAARLVAEVADALHYAHGQGVIHRDLKPSNLLVDAEGRPHVLDFGLARSASADEETLTLDGQILGTPAYMAPELARGEARRADARCDVYSLGVILYELLTGERPFRGQGRMVLIQVLEEEPRPPRRLDDAIPRDLETICLKAMAKEPPWRYPTAGAMAEDLRRFLRGEPVAARPLGPAGRLWRRCRRRPVASATAASLALAVVLGLAGVTWQWRRAEAHAAEAGRQRARAWAALDRAHAAVLAFARLGRDSALMSPEGRPLQSALIRVALDYYDDVLDAGRNDPAMLVEMAMACEGGAEVLGTLNVSADAQKAAGQAVAAWEALVRRHPGGLDFREHLARSCRRRAVQLRMAGRSDEALRSFAQAGAVWEGILRLDPARPAYSAALARNMVETGALLKELGRRDEAVAAFRRARALHESPGRDAGGAPEDRESLASCLYYLVELLRPAGPTEEVADALARCRELIDGLLREQPSHVDYLIIRAKIAYQTGALLRDRGRALEALAAYRRSEGRFAHLVAILPATPGFRRDLGASRHNIGNLLAELGRPEEAIAAYRAAIAVREELCRLQSNRPGHRRDLAGTWRNLGDVLDDLGLADEAAEAYRHADGLGRPSTADAAPAAQPRSS